MKHCKSKVKNDCGICALSTLSGVSYDFLRPLENEGRTSSCWFMMFGASFLTGKKHYRVKKSGIFEHIMTNDFIRIAKIEPMIINTRRERDGYTHFIVLHNGLVYDSELDSPELVKDYKRNNWEVLEIIIQKMEILNKKLTEKDTTINKHIK